MATETAAALAKKLRLTPESHLLALDAPEEYQTLLRESGIVASLATRAAKGKQYDAVHLFTRTLAEAEKALPPATLALREGGVFWAMWPKKSSGVATDLTRDTLAALAMRQGWGPVSNVSVDETWSALRLRPEGDVKRTGTTWAPTAF